MTPAESADPPPGDDGLTPPPDRVEAFGVAGRALDAAGVRWCRLRPRDGGAEDDLLVDPHDLGTARRTLRAVGWRERRQPGHGSHRAFLRYDPDLDRWWKIDLVSSLDVGRWQEWPTGLAAGCLERRRTTPDGPTLDSDDAFWTLLLHELVDRPGSPIRRRDRLRETAAGSRLDSPAASVVTRLAGRAWSASAIAEAAGNGDDARLQELGRAMGRTLARRPAVRLRAFMSRAIRWLDHRDPPFIRRGRTIALLGPDGAGKSSVATMIGRGGPMPLRTVYLGLYGGSRASLGRAGRHRIPGAGFVTRLVAMWRGWAVGAWHASRGRLVVFDRHPLDARLQTARGGPTGARGLVARLRRKILGHALPVPDLVVILDAPADVLVARKSEHPVERIAEQRERYLALAGQLDRAVVVDATLPLEVIARRITALAWEGAASGAGPR